MYILTGDIVSYFLCVPEPLRACLSPSKNNNRLFWKEGRASYVGASRTCERTAGVPRTS
jgi:hypothetical protein